MQLLVLFNQIHVGIGVTIGLPSGTYDANVTVDNTTVNAFVTILSTVKGTDVVKMYKNDTQYYATFLDTEGKFLADGTTVISTLTECSTSAKY